MSTLTKVMIFLLALASIFLCGTVVPYVSSATNYKEALDRANVEKQKERNDRAKAEDDLVKVKAAIDKYKEEITAEIARLNTEKADLQKANDALAKENSSLKKANDEASTSVTTLTTTNAQQVKLIDSHREELKQANEKLTILEARLSETSNALIAKMGIIEGLDAEKRQLTEQMAELQKQLNQLLTGQGRQVVRPVPVTPSVGAVQPVPPATIGREIALKGTVSQVDMDNGVARISIGSATGVRQDMRFFIVRGNSFICEIRIIDVQPDTSVGILQRCSRENPPKPGDSIQTNL